MADIPNYNVLNISFPATNADGTLVLSNAGNTQNNPTRAEVQAAQAQGKKVLISIGGANGRLYVGNQSQENNFVNSFIAIAEEFGVDGIDIDTEHGLTTNPNGQINTTNPSYTADYLVRAIRRIRTHFGSSFMLTMAPETAHTIGANTNTNWLGGTNWGVYLPLINEMRNEISWVQVQYYNTGGMPGATRGQFYQAATQDGLVAWSEAMIEGFQIASTGVYYQGLPANKVVIGLPASTATSAAGSGYSNPTIVKAAVKCLRTRQCGSGYTPANAYPDLKGVMAWSAYEDYLVSYFFSNSIASCVLNNQCN